MKLMLLYGLTTLTMIGFGPFWSGSGNAEAVITVEQGYYEGIVDSGQGIVGYPGELIVVDSEFAKGFLVVAECESGYDQKAVGKALERGLLQIHPIHRPLIERMGYTWDAMFNGTSNIVVAIEIWSWTRSWQAWSCSAQR